MAEKKTVKTAPKVTKKEDVKKHLSVPASPVIVGEVHESMEECKGCKHQSAAHYGSANKWCNITGCQCQAYKGA